MIGARLPLADGVALGRTRISPTVMLDLDDVLCMSKPWGGFDAIAVVEGRHPDPTVVYRDLFLRSAVGALKEIHGQMAGDVRYVISSTWRESFTRPALEGVFRQSGLGFVADALVVGDRWRTPLPSGNSRRIDEIAEWLDRHHQGEPFAIIDDTWSGASMASVLGPTEPARPHPFAERVVLCQENVGLTDAHVSFVVAALRRGVVMPGVTA